MVKPHSSNAGPLCVTGHTSANTPPTLLSGAPPKTPPKNRVISKVWISLAVAEANEKRASANIGMRMEYFRPYASEIGAHRRGPKAFLYLNQSRIFEQC